MKLRIGVDRKTGWRTALVMTSANVHDKHPLPDLLQGAEKRPDLDDRSTGAAFKTRR